MRMMLSILCCLFLISAAIPAAALTTEQLAAARDKAVAGDVMSQVDVGDHYYSRSQFTEALKWYQMAAKQGQFDSRMRIARMYLKGEGTPQDLLKSYVLFSKIMQNYVLYPESQQALERQVEELAAQLSPDQLAEAEKRIEQAWNF